MAPRVQKIARQPRNDRICPPITAPSMGTIEVHAIISDMARAAGSRESGVKGESSASRMSSTGVSGGRLASEVGAMGAFIAAGLAANPGRVPCYKRAMTSLPDMTEMQIRRYARHIVLAEIGGTGQARLIAAKVLVVGAGGPGAPLLQYLSAAGIRNLGVIDDDPVDLSHLQR